MKLTKQLIKDEELSELEFPTVGENAYWESKNVMFKFETFEI